MCRIITEETTGFDSGIKVKCELDEIDGLDSTQTTPQKQKQGQNKYKNISKYHKHFEIDDFSNSDLLSELFKSHVWASRPTPSPTHHVTIMLATVVECN